MPDEDVQEVAAAPARPKTRWGYDDDGNEIQPPASGLVFNPETGMAEVPKAEPAAPPPAPKAQASKAASSSSTTS